MNNTTTFTQQIMVCPACGKDIFATFSSELRIGSAVANMPASDVTVDAKLHITGMRIEHNCIPQLKRVLEPQREKEAKSI